MNDIAVTLTSDTRKFSQGMKNARQDLALFSAAAQSLKAGLVAGGAAIAGFFAISTVKSGLSELKNTIGQLDDLAAQSERLGVSTEFLSELHHAASLSDTDIEALNGGLEKLEKNLGKATIEGGDLTKMLARAGLDADELAKAGPEEAFMRIADAVSRIRDPLQRAAFVTDVFGKSGQSLVGILSKGRAGIQELREEAQRLGVSLDSETAQKIGLADDSLKRFDASWKGLKTTLVVEVLPAITSTMNYLSRLIASWRSFRKDIGDDLERLRRQALPKNGMGVADPNLPGKGGGLPDLDLGGIQKDFKSFASPIAIETREGFGILARALTRDGNKSAAEKQLAETKKSNAHLSRIEDGLKNQPKIAPPF
jgi:hypothetical protein